MAASRRGQPMQIYQDPIVYDQQANLIDPTEAAVYHALGPLSESARNQSANFAPQYQYPTALSPVKHPGQASSPATRNLHQPYPGQVHFPPPHHYPPHMNSPEKKLSPMPVMPMPNNYFIAPAMDQENMYGAQFQHGKPQFQPAEVYGQKGMLKRTLMDAAPLAPVPENKPSAKRHKKVESLPLKPVANPLPSSQPEAVGPIELPDPSSLPAMEDDGTKPLYSYAQLIGMAILRAPNRRLTLASIYKWISDNFSFYSSTDSGWQNSIRHNLSLNKAFIKQERPKDDPGKGNYWAIKPGSEMQFLKDRPKRNSDANIFLQALTEPVRPSTAPVLQSFAPPPPAPAKVDSSRFPDDEPSSDATIDASDPDIHGGNERAQNGGQGAEDIRSSPPPADIRSSPPPGLEEHVGTPPPVPMFPGTVRASGHKRRFSRVASAMQDSGYYSSIESSATRNRGNLLTSEADMTHPFKRRGRAEEEIARIRSSSYDSPSKNPPTLHPTAVSGGISSSPFRPFDATTVPLTPPVVFKKPAKPILSVSPATNLRNHRDHVKRMLASPEKGMSAFASSPLRLELFNPDFDVYAGVENDFNSLINQSPAARGSPAKRTIKRPRYERAATTTGVLADVTGNSLTLSAEVPPSPYKLFKPDWADHAGLGSPSKFWPSPIKKPLQSQQSAPTSNPGEATSAMSVPSLQLQTDDDVLFGIELPSDSSEPGFDITQDFQRIGAMSTAGGLNLSSMTAGQTFSPVGTAWAMTGSPSKKPQLKKPAGIRPGISRTVSSTF